MLRRHKIRLCQENFMQRFMSTKDAIDGLDLRHMPKIVFATILTKNI